MGMNLKERVDQDLKEALRARDEVRLNTLRQIKTLVKNKEVELIHPLDDPGVVQILHTLVKQRRESIEQFTNGGHKDLADKEALELTILQGYLPQAMSETELARVIDDIISGEAASGAKDMGRVMKAVIAKVAGRADGKIISELVKQRLK